MKPVIKQFLKFIVIFVVIGYLGCASVPREVVELSYTIGKDINSIHISYKHLIKTHFDDLRRKVVDFMEAKWEPVFLGNFIKKTGLADKLKAFTPAQVLAYLQKWIRVANSEIHKKREQLLRPINEDERKLLADVDAAFLELNYANAVVTANLNSIRKVKELEDKAFSTVHLQDFRRKVTDFMATSSKRVEETINLLKKGGTIVDKVDEKKKELIEKARELINKERKK